MGRWLRTDSGKYRKYLPDPSRAIPPPGEALVLPSNMDAVVSRPGTTTYDRTYEAYLLLTASRQ